MSRRGFGSKRFAVAVALVGLAASSVSDAAAGPMPPASALSSSVITPSRTAPVLPFAKDAARGLVYDGLESTARGSACAKAGLLRVAATGGCTHGPDPASVGVDVHESVAPLSASVIEATPPITCVGDGTSGYRTEVMYVRASDRVDRYDTYVASIGAWAREADQIYSTSAAETGGDRRVRFVHTAGQPCEVIVRNVVIPPSDDDNFGATTSAVRALGYDAADRRYMMFVDANVYCGVGYIENDDQPGQSNRNNSGASYGRSDAGCWSGRVVAHEHMHNLGGVQLSAPHTSGGYHCVDEYDVMCYSDAPFNPPMQYLCASSSHDNRFDCNHDDYFSTSPPIGSYLATHWNTADSRFLINGNELVAIESAAPKVASDGTNYLVVWEDNRTGDADIWAAQVTPSGSVVSTFPIHDDTGNNDVQPAVAFNGTNFLVAWQSDDPFDPLGNQDVKAVRVSPTGAVLGSPFHVSKYGFAARPRVGAVGSQWLVAWENLDGRGILAARVDGSGSLIDPFDFTVNSVGTDQRNLTVFAHGGRWVIGWNDNRNGNADIFYTTVNTSGIVSDSTGIQVTNSPLDDFGVRGQSAGSNALLTWTNVGDVRGARLNSTSGLIDPFNGFGIATGSAQQKSPVVEKLNSSTWLVLWNEQASNTNVKSRTVKVSKSRGSVRIVTSAAGDQLYPAVARGASNVLSVWQDGRAVSTQGNDIYGRRFTTLGALSGAEFNIG